MKERYSAPAIALHWATFALIVCGAGLALYMVDLPLSPAKLKYYAWHKGLGITVLIFTVARLLWRLIHPAPTLPAVIPAWQRNLATMCHALLYILMIVIPLTGWLYSSAEGVPTVYLRLVQLPDLVAKDPVLAEFLRAIHIRLNYTLFALVCLHVAAVVQHHITGHPLLNRMRLPINCSGER